MAKAKDIIEKARKALKDGNAKLEDINDILADSIDDDDPPSDDDEELDALSKRVETLQTELQRCLDALSALPKDQDKELREQITTLQQQIRQLTDKLEAQEQTITTLSSTRQNSQRARIV